jgi:hypothetical protein
VSVKSTFAIPEIATAARVATAIRCTIAAVYTTVREALETAGTVASA